MEFKGPGEDKKKHRRKTRSSKAMATKWWKDMGCAVADIEIERRRPDPRNPRKTIIQSFDAWGFADLGVLLPGIIGIVLIQACFGGEGPEHARKMEAIPTVRTAIENLNTVILQEIKGRGASLEHLLFLFTIEHGEFTVRRVELDIVGEQPIFWEVTESRPIPSHRGRMP